MRFSHAVAFACLLAANIAAQKVRVVVQVPADTPGGDAVCLAGSLPGAGSWKADGVKLNRQVDGTYAGDLELEAGQTLEFKITRGSWETVEKDADGSERANRSVQIDASTKRIDVTVERWAGGGDTKRRTVVGTLKLHKIDSQPLRQTRTIRVWLPPEYDVDPKGRCDVLYMHDGQNCFDRATSAFGNEWEIDETLTKLIEEKRLPPIIVVGIDNGLSNRIDEYTHIADPQHGGGGAAAYAQFLLEEVKPFIEKTYRTKPGPAHTFIGGSSLGGLVSLEIIRRHKDVFGGVVAMSPAIWWADGLLTKEIANDAGGLSTARVWIDMGTRERMGGEKDHFVHAIRRLDAALAGHEVEHRLVIDDGAEHNEQAWARRFPEAITFLLKPE